MITYLLGYEIITYLLGYDTPRIRNNNVSPRITIYNNVSPRKRYNNLSPRIRYKMVCLSLCFYTVFWVVYMSYVAVSYFVLHQRSAVQCVTTSECIIGGAPPDIVYGVPYIIPTVIVMVSLGVTMWHLQVNCAINPPPSTSR